MRIASLQVAAETASTQADALAAPVPARGCAVFLAERQRAGLGRRGRAWVSEEGNLAMSVSRRLARPLRALPGLSLARGVAVAEALHALGVPEAGLKWPNDLVADGRKLGGLLVDARAHGEGSIVVVGVGVNIALAQDAGAAIDQPWCDLASLGHALARETVATAAIAAIAGALEAFDAQGFAAFAARWATLDAWIGRAALIVDGGRVETGTGLGVDADGALRLATESGERRFHAGELSLRPA
jgi:BirA family biotin operon repressor/biotin-[acetyl-CoA-carboxylase] ligase